MKLFIPELGTKLILTKAWKFRLYPERRNESLIKLVDLKYVNYWNRKGEYKNQTGFVRLDSGEPNIDEFIAEKFGGRTNDNSSEIYNAWNEAYAEWWDNVDKQESVHFTIPKGCELTVDRIYIRKGGKDFSSISFYVKGLDKTRKRFWAKLDDCNKINFKTE